MRFWEWLADLLDRRSPEFVPPPSSVPEYERPPQPNLPPVRLTRAADDQRAEEALDFLRGYIAGVRAGRGGAPPTPPRDPRRGR